MAYNRLIGNTGEDIACTWLLKRKYIVIERNYLKKWGEIDIIAEKDNTLHFIEVKSTTRQGTGHRPEENVHELKTRRLKRTIQTYLLERKYNSEKEFQFHVLTVHMNIATRRARVEFLENIIL